jgi:hypothetical protein
MSTNIWPSVDPKKIIFVGASKKAFSKECVGNKDFLVAVCITLSTTRSSYIRFQFGMMFFFGECGPTVEDVEGQDRYIFRVC